MIESTDVLPQMESCSFFGSNIVSGVENTLRKCHTSYFWRQLKFKASVPDVISVEFTVKMKNNVVLVGYKPEGRRSGGFGKYLNFCWWWVASKQCTGRVDPSQKVWKSKKIYIFFSGCFLAEGSKGRLDQETFYESLVVPLWGWTYAWQHTSPTTQIFCVCLVMHSETTSRIWCTLLA